MAERARPDLVRVAQVRLRRLLVVGRPLPAPTDVVGWLGAVQAQDFGPAKWSVAMRARNAVEADVDRLFAAGAILRTHVLRPTWHFVLPADIRWMLQLTAPRVHALNAFMYRQLELDAAVRGKAAKVMVGALRGGNQLTRAELVKVLARAGLVAAGFRMAYLLMHAELEGLICSGAPQGKLQTYALLEDRAPSAQPLARDAALTELTRRYFRSHGPATAKDFQAWCSLTLSDVRRGLELAGAQLQQDEIDGIPCWSAPAGGQRVGSSVKTQLHLLQGYDEYVMGYRETRHVLHAIDRGSATRVRQTAAYVGLVIRAGQFVGHWKRILKKEAVVIEVALCAPLDAAGRRALQAAADHHGRFLERPASVTISAI
jgi:hypothetical protein